MIEKDLEDINEKLNKLLEELEENIAISDDLKTKCDQAITELRIAVAKLCE